MTTREEYEQAVQYVSNSVPPGDWRSTKIFGEIKTIFQIWWEL